MHFVVECMTTSTNFGLMNALVAIEKECRKKFKGNLYKNVIRPVILKL